MTTTASSAARTATDDEIASVEEQLRRLFGRVRLVWKEAAAAVHPDLQPVGYKILSALVHRGRMHAGAIAEVFEIDKSVVSRQIRMLEELGLVETRPDETDGRVRLLVATPNALAAVHGVRDRNQQRLRDVLAGHAESELSSFANLLRSIGDA